MRHHAYRDPMHGARARLEQRRREAERGEARLTPAFLARLPGELVSRLAALRADCDVAGEELDDLARAEGAYAAYCAALEDTLAQKPTVEAAFFATPETVPDPEPRANASIGLFWSHGDELELADTVRQISAHLARLDPDVEIIRTGPGRLSRLARFRSSGAPFSMRVELASTDRPWAFLLTIATSVPRAMPRLVLRPEGFGEALARSFGVRRTEIGDERFDGMFVIEGHSGARLLTPAVRASLLEVAYFDIPRLVVEVATATLSFSFDPLPACIGAAIRVLLRLRSVPVDLRIGEGE